MLKVGIIGNVSSMQPFVQHLKKEPGFEIIGKSSIGMIDQPADSLLSVPEYVKTALLVASDILIIDKWSMVTFDYLKEAVRKFKHLFFSDIPELTPSQCLDLQKLASESGNIVQVRNPLMEEPVAFWIARNWQEPAYVNYFEGNTKIIGNRKILVKLLLYAHRLFKESPQKIRVSGINNQGTNSSFLNIRLDYSTFSAINFEILQQPENEIKIRAALPGKFIESASSNQFLINHEKVATDIQHISEFSVFIENLKSGNLNSGTGLHTLNHVLDTYEELVKKLSLYAPWYV
jgi:hypothetical protein